MATLKVIEVLAESGKSWEDAAQVAISKVAGSVRGIRSVYIKDMEATVDKDRIDRYRINAKISFTVD